MKGTLKYITIIVVIVCFLANNTPIYASPALRPTNSKISGEGEVRSELASLNNNASAIDSVREMQNLLEEAIASNRNWERCTAEQLIEHIKDQFLEGKLPV